MKKVININFQGRVIPIEETAYELLKQYVESLRRYFANEEGRDEIINDIESRIAELFSERLKKGSTCITDEDVNAVIVSMGRPEDFQAQEGEPISAASGKSYSEGTGQSYSFTAPRGRVFRNQDDKILGGVCSGLANYFRIDPVILRIIFVLFIPALFWVYIVLWIILPAQSANSNITKRLFRSTDDKVIAGVCGGIAAYFNIEPWIPRLIFALPLILALVSGSFDAFYWDWDFGFLPRMISGSLGSTLFITYVILWISVPVALTAADKLEMKGERINLNSIRDTVKEDLSGFKQRAEKWGAEVKQSAQQFGERAKEFGQTAGSQAKSFAAEASPAARRTGRGLGHVIGILFKAVFLFIAGIIALSLFGAFIGLLFGGMAFFPLKNFVLEGFWQNLMAWATLFLFLGIPIIALITWLIRRIIGVRSKNHYLGYVFGSLWLIGLVAAITLAGMFARNFKSRSMVENEIASIQPPNGKMFVDVVNNNVRYFGGDWFGIDHDEDWPFYGINEDTLMINTVRVNVVKSKDSSFHIYKVLLSRGRSPEEARSLAEKIDFNVSQQDSLLLLPRGFAITRDEKWRNQQVLVVVEVPVGRKIELDRSIDNYEWFNVNLNRRRGWNNDWEENWDRNFGWQSNVEYTMTPEGLERTDRLDPNELKKGNYKLKDERFNRDEEDESPIIDTIRRSDTSSVKVRISSASYKSESIDADAPYSADAKQMDISTPLSVFSRLFQ